MIITLQDYKLVAQINSPNNDERLEYLIELVSDFITTYCGREFDYQEYVEEIPSNRGLLMLRNMPVGEIVKLEYFNSFREWAEIEEDDYNLKATAGEIELYSNYATFSRKSNPFRVTYIGGFEEIPSSLKLAALDLVTFYHKRESSPRKTINNISIASPENDYSYLPRHIKRVLDLYRIIEV